MFCKIDALQNFAILRIENTLSQTCFPIESSHVNVNILIDFVLKPLYLFLKNWSIPKHILVCSVKMNLSNCNRRNQNSLASYFFTRDIDQYKNKSLSQLYQPPRTPFPQTTYHQPLSSCEYCKVFKNSFLQNTSRSSPLQMFFKIGILKSLTSFTGKHLRWNPFFKNMQVEGLQLY